MWCIDLTKPSVVNRPPVMTSYMDSFHYLLMPAHDPSNALVVVSLRQRLYAFPIQKNNIGNFVPAWADADMGRFTLNNIMLLLAHSRQTTHYNTSALTTLHWFRCEFKREITDRLRESSPPANWLPARVTGASSGIHPTLEAINFLFYSVTLPNTIMQWKDTFPGLGEVMYSLSNWEEASSFRLVPMTSLTSSMFGGRIHSRS